MKKIAGALGLVTVLLSGAAVATNYSNTPLLVTAIETDNDPTTGTTVYVYFGSVPDGKPVCDSIQTKVVLLSGTADQIKALTNTATAAFLAGRPVRVQWTGSCNTPGFGLVTGLLVQ